MNQSYSQCRQHWQASSPSSAPQQQQQEDNTEHSHQDSEKSADSWLLHQIQQLQNMRMSPSGKQHGGLQFGNPTHTVCTQYPGQYPNSASQFPQPQPTVYPDQMQPAHASMQPQMQPAYVPMQPQIPGYGPMTYVPEPAQPPPSRRLHKSHWRFEMRERERAELEWRRAAMMQHMVSVNLGMPRYGQPGMLGNDNLPQANEAISGPSSSHSSPPADQMLPTGFGLNNTPSPPSAQSSEPMNLGLHGMPSLPSAQSSGPMNFGLHGMPSPPSGQSSEPMIQLYDEFSGPKTANCAFSSPEGESSAPVEERDIESIAREALTRYIDEMKRQG